MKKKHTILNAILWAAAIIASALLHGPIALNLILISLATASIIATHERPMEAGCRP